LEESRWEKRGVWGRGEGSSRMFLRRQKSRYLARPLDCRGNHWKGRERELVTGEPPVGGGERDLGRKLVRDMNKKGADQRGPGR